MLTARQQEICGEFVMHARGSIFCPECGCRVTGRRRPGPGSGELDG